MKAKPIRRKKTCDDSERIAFRVSEVFLARQLPSREVCFCNSQTADIREPDRSFVSVATRGGLSDPPQVAG